MENLLTLSTLRLESISAKLHTALQNKDRPSVISFLASLFQNLGFPNDDVFSVLAFGEKPTVVELTDRQDVIVHIAAQIYLDAGLTLQELENTVPSQAIPYILLALITNERAVTDTTHNPFILISRYLIRTITQTNTEPNDRIIPHTNLLKTFLDESRDTTVICQLSSELGEYCFCIDEFGEARRFLGRALDAFGSSNDSLFCTVDRKRLEDLIRGCTSVIERKISLPQDALVTSMEDTNEEKISSAIQKTRPFQLFHNDPNLRVYFALLTQITEDDVDLLRSVRMDIAPQRQVTLLLTHLKTVYEKNDIHLAEKLLGHILELASTFSLDTIQLTSVAEMGQLLQLERGEKTPVVVAAVLEQVYMQLRSSQVLPRTDFMKRIFALLLRGRYEHTSVLLQDFAARLLNMLQQGAITDVEQGGMLCCLSQMVSQCFQIMDAMALGQDSTVYDDIPLLDRITKVPHLIEQLKETGYVLAAAVGDQNISTARIHFVDVLKKSGDIRLLWGVGGLVAGVVNGLLGNAKIHVGHFGAFAYITDSEATHDPRFVDILPRLKTPTPSSSHLLRPELVPNILEFLKGVYMTIRHMDPFDERVVGALGDVYFACGAVREAFCLYVMGLECSSRGFTNIPQIQWYHLPRLVQCAEQSNEYLVATVFCQLYPTLAIQRTLGLLTKALSVRPQQWIVEDKGPVEGVVSVFWDVVVLEFAIAYFKSRNESTTVDLLLRVMSRPELAPSAEATTRQAYIHYVLEPFLKALVKSCQRVLDCMLRE
ncbi:uncharacterized protein SPPG_07318 [Spizellomyces punctatus DAOM BR117]|uniref:INTS8 TPR repeats domain-containing protein n=1 Tax=Spizellomyces punctatus (strain DAOM BR117) TaxID=645134 RepID=A0A0L0H8R7_SPIPD|nr:uncharacterized protein SPPG_07318 [Spizellomyces punctatus DAOM BR117]KNC97391.1 hypothetical protein SPPG_07318 [Spizellomyces punctatus DAOM BR117]|eukprot:XP_016605431.1 hypothetical protein SPPG_07318 [Spizellomyces punctatus DAOM BR117]